MQRWLSLLLLLVASPAAVQVTIQEYALPPKLYAHDVWVDPARACIGSPVGTGSTEGSIRAAAR